MNGTWIGCILIVLACLAVEALGSLATVPSIADGWYGSLAKPGWTPPGAVFGPVWTLLYLMMAVAACRIWRLRANTAVRAALAAFFLQLLLNMGWSQLFFLMKSPFAGLIDIVLLFTILIVTVILFLRLDRVAGLLLIPYLCWIAFAALLNLAILRMNS